jgi:hypothetical protein
VLNEERGRQSAGFFDSTGDWLKNAVSPKEFLRDERLRKFMNKAAKNTWALCAHTRQSTRGAIITDNAHPFQYGPVVGSHNGTVPSAPNDYAVDSMWLFHKLSTAAPGDYQTALGDVYGWYALTWFDSRNSMLYLLNWEGSLAFNKVKGIIYYSSLGSHLETATGHKVLRDLKSGEVWQFDGVKAKQLADFKGKEHTKTSYYVGRNWEDDGMGWQGGRKNWTSDFTLKGRRVDLSWWKDQPPNGATFTGCWCISPTGSILGFFSDFTWRYLRSDKGAMLEQRLHDEVKEAATQIVAAKVRMAIKMGMKPAVADHASVVAAILAASRVRYDKETPTILPKAVMNTATGQLYDDVEDQDIVLEPTEIAEEKPAEQKPTEQKLGDPAEDDLLVGLGDGPVTPSQLVAMEKGFQAEQALRDQQSMDAEDLAACNFIADPDLRDKAKQRIRERTRLLGLGYTPDAAGELLTRQGLM